MGRHNLFTRFAPRAPRLRFAVSRAAVLVLALVVLGWIGISILLAPPPQATQLETVPLVSDPQTPAEPGDPGVQSADQAPHQTTDQATDQATEATVTVHVVGAVHRPGVYTLPAGARLVDAIGAAGGPLPEARPDLLNLAATLADGEQVVLPDETNTAPPGVHPDTNPETNGTSSGTSSATTADAPKISLNTADAQTLQQLPGIGPALAARIIDFRTRNGPFASVEELDAVPGIGPAILNNVRELVEP